MFMSRDEIKQVTLRWHDCPNVRKGLKLLSALAAAVDAQSDGWAHWKPPSNSCQQLQALLHTAGNLRLGTRGTITDAALKKAVAPIRSMLTHQRKIQAKYGNTFDFDVDAALA